MIKQKCFQKEWILNLRQDRFPKTAPQLIEKTIYAFELLSLLADSGKEFVFKGGTSLLLLVPNFDRFSIDIDIIGHFSISELEQSIQNSVFLHVKEVLRKTSDIPKQHFKFTYASISGKEESILLDVLTDSVPYKTLKTVPIKTDLFKVDKVITVLVPTIVEILADKLTAFAPHTIGIRYGVNKETEIVKQLFDIGRLFKHITDLDMLIETYETIANQENVYRDNQFSTNEILNDTIQTGINLCRIDLKGFIDDDKVKALRMGIKTVGAYLFDGKLPFEQAKIYAARAALIAKIILSKQKDFNLHQLEYTVDKIDQLDTDIFPPKFAHLQRLKKINSECFYYLHQLFTI
ncbi:nucleotidyl transferase AbiEii/AbiGii toxin family protein [bacterium]|nr:nucleotidyl transferase AbiEii/AbiGii toxin family protein [bacterium]MBU1064432.1 nucleotidyl transferase AbiEii/AbiGii toxin family protein [bacterium]MBU1635324.1 nucleotidyl transferase AbiEii/AbiGii toxin family protein [bacterium]MBU1872104.1 nucleotidyl transferase AbiEii/AbiGii toxin family protein [bacterium]